MRKRGTSSIFVAFAVAAAVAVTAACADSQPPLDELSMRDALGADPSVVHALPQEAREALADKFKNAIETQVGTVETENGGPITPAQEVHAIDDSRAARDLDSMLAADIVVAAGQLVAHAHAASAIDAGSASPPPLPQIEGDVPAISKDEETRALSGAAGDVIKKLLADTHARRVMRVTGWPMAAVAIDDVVYVNASWLVAMAAREPAAPASNAAANAGVVSFVAPQSLRGNPYHLYNTLNECIGDVTTRCETCVAGGTCDEHATLSDQSDGKTECQYLLGGGERAAYSGGPGVYTRVQELCAMALLDVCTVADCVQKESCTLPIGLSVSASVSISSNMLVSADVFVTDDHCVKALDLCLSGTPFGLDAGFDLSLDIKVEGCDDPAKACGSTCSACTSTCSSGRCSGNSTGPSCSSCSSLGQCSGFGSDSRTSGGTNSGYGSGGFQAGGSQKGASSGSCGSCGSSSAGGSSGQFAMGFDAGPMDAGPTRSARRVDDTHSPDLLGEDGGASGTSGGRAVDRNHDPDIKSVQGHLNGAGEDPDENDIPPGMPAACAAGPEGDPPFAPATTFFWLFLPIAYLISRTRRVA